MESASDLLGEIKRLMELKGENPFKVRAFDKAIDVARGRDDLAARAKAGTLTELPGIGKGIAEVLTEFLLHGKSSVRDELRGAVSPALLELTALPGLGPKKAQLLIDELGIQTIGELEYACRENRLLKIKGFGEKLQNTILEGIQFHSANQGQQRLDEAFEDAEALCAALTKAAAGARVSEAGALRRRAETLTELDFVIEGDAQSRSDGDTKSLGAKVERAIADFAAKRGKKSLPVRVHYATKDSYGYELAKRTASEAHWKAIGAPKAFAASDEEGFYSHVGISVPPPPETRETGEEVALAKTGGLARLLPWNGVRGVFHNHTTRSDGTGTLEEMVLAAKKLGYEYLGVSDHSKSAVYAHGLTDDAVAEQEKEVRKVQERHPDFRIFWGVESDILADGSLDYEPKLLKRFDFVIASVHSRFQMDRAAMTERILAAIRNPHTRFLGHATGRLLLGRKPYELDMERVIAEAARHGVAIELNANPARLDIDWRWGPEMRKRGTMTSINPDAHSTSELANTRFGIAMARKALLPSELVVNARGTAEVEKWLKRA